MGRIREQLAMTKEQSIKLISLFYAHLLHVEDVCSNPEAESDGMLNLSISILNELKALSVQEIIEILKNDYEEFKISTSEIPQFSSFEDVVFRVPYLTIASRETNIPFIQMGYMLLTIPKKDGAYFKYGENQAKTAALIGLCAVRKGKINPSYLGIAYTRLTKDEQKDIVPKLLLFMPIIQNFFVMGMNVEQLREYFSLLSESTQIRRWSNVKTLINTVGKFIGYEL